MLHPDTVSASRAPAYGSPLALGVCTEPQSNVKGRDLCRASTPMPCSEQGPLKRLLRALKGLAQHLLETWKEFL